MTEQDFSLFDRVSRRVARTTSPVALTAQMDAAPPPPKSPTPDDPRTKSFPTLFPIAAPGIGAGMIEDGQLKPITDKPFLTSEPALGSKVDITYGDPFLGSKAIKTRKRDIEFPSALTPKVSVRAAGKDGAFIPSETAPDVVRGKGVEPTYLDISEDSIMNAAVAINKDGVRESLTGANLQQRINVINAFEATALGYERAGSIQSIDLPFDKITEDITTYTKSMRDKVMAIPGIGDDNDLHLMLNFGTDEETNRAIYANKLVERLKKIGITDERRIAGIVSYQANLDQFRGLGFGDVSKLVGSTRQGARFVIEFPGLLLGETYDLLTKDKPENSEEFDLAKSEDRGAYYDRMFPNQAAAIQDRFLQMGITVSYAEAERLARDFSGVSTLTAAIAAEIKPSTGVATSIKRLSGERESKLFRQYAQRQRKIFGDGISEEEIFVNFKRHRQQQLPIFGVNIAPAADKLYDIRFLGIGKLAQAVGNKIAYVNGIRSSNALKAGMNVEEAALSVSNRPEVRNLINYRRNLFKQRSAILSKSRNEGRLISSAEKSQVDDITRKLNVSKKELRIIAAESQSPRFVVEASKLDRDAIIFGAAGNQLVSIFTDADPMLGEFFGGFSAVVYHVFKDLNEGGALLNKMRRDSNKKKDIKSAELIIRNMQGLSPEFQAAMQDRIRYFNQLKQELIQIGVPENILETSSINIMSLSILQAIEEGHRLELNAPSAAYFNDTLELLQQNADIQSRYASELRAAYRSLSEQQGIDPNNDSVRKFYSYVEQSLELAESNIKQLTYDIDIINRSYASSLEGYIRGSGDGMAHIDTDTNANLDLAFERLADYSIQRADKSKISEIRNAAKESNDFMLQAAEKKAKEISRRLPNQQQVNRAVDEVSPDGKIISPGKKPIKTAAIETAGDAFAVVLESVHIEQKKIASAPYIKLDNSQFFFRDAAGNTQEVFGVPTTDAGPILDTMFKVMGGDDGIDLILELQQSTLRKTEATRVHKILDDFAGGFLHEVAERSPDVTDLNQFIDDAISFAKESSDPILRKLANDPKLKNNKNLIAAYAYRVQAKNTRDVDIETIPMSFIQAKELTEAFGSLAYKAGTPQSKNAIKELRGVAASTMDDFSIINQSGQKIPVGNLLVENEGEFITVSDLLRRADAGWSEYKNRFFEEGEVRRWMGWSDPNARKGVDPSTKYPLGINYGKNEPITWIDLNKIGEMEDVQLRSYSEMFSRTFGEKGPDNEFRINYDSPLGKALSASLEAHLREYLIETVQSGKPIDYNQLLRKANKMQEAFVAHRSSPDVSGETKVAFLDANKVINDVFPDYSSTTLSKQDYEAAEKALERGIKSEASRVAREAGEVKQIYADSAKFLQQYSADRLDASTVANVIFEGGPERVKNLKDHLKSLGRNEDSINLALKGILVQEIESKAFKLTSLNTPDPENSSRLLPEAELNVEALKQILGLNNKTRQDAVKDILGADYYDKYMSLVEFIQAKSMERMSGINMVGIPRPFSIESYISRFYALQRNVVSFRYVATEAVLQSYRQKNMKLITAALTDPAVGNALLEIIATGRPLSVSQDRQLFNALLITSERFSNVFHTKEEVELPEENGYKAILNMFGFNFP